LSPLNCAGWPLLTGTLDVFTELVVEVDFFSVELLIIFGVVLMTFVDVDAGLEEVVIFFEVETGFEGVVIFLEPIELGLFVLVGFFEVVLTFSVLVNFLLVEVGFLVLDDF
jgi:hypothetical protein